jgi:hypothetical protein
MIFTGKASGKTIELDEPLPYPDGLTVRVTVEPVPPARVPGSPPAILEVMRAEPHLASEEVDELERAIEESKLPVSGATSFESGT